MVRGAAQEAVFVRVVGPDLLDRQGFPFDVAPFALLPQLESRSSSFDVSCDVILSLLRPRLQAPCFGFIPGGRGAARDHPDGQVVRLNGLVDDRIFLGALDEALRFGKPLGDFFLGRQVSSDGTS